MTIPKRIHQTWKNEDVPESLARMTRSWKAMHPGWEYSFWTDEMNRSFIKNHFPDFLPVYDGYEANIQRVDAVRYFVLYKFGGFFIDLDFECLANILPIVQDKRCVFGKEPDEHCRWHNKSMIVSNAFMGAEPGHPFFRRICAELAEYRPVTDHPNDRVLESTGPFMLTRVYCDYEPKKDIGLLEPSVIYPLTKDEVARWSEGVNNHDLLDKLKVAYGVHHYAGTWWKKPEVAGPYYATGEQVQNWYYHIRLGDEKPHQVVNVATMIRGLDVAAMERAVECLIRRHEGLRTFFREEEDGVKQLVMAYRKELFAPVQYDVSGLSGENDKAEAISRIIEEDKQKLRKMDAPPLVRTSIFKITGDSHYLSMQIHHILADEWSAALVYKELSLFYERSKRGVESEAGPLVWQMRDYAAWQKAWWEENKADLRQYWATKLSFLQEVTAPEGRLALLNEGKGVSFSVAVDPVIYMRLLKIEKNSGITIRAILVASLQLVFYALGKDTILIATVVSGRTMSHTEALIGTLGGGIYLRQRVDPAMTLSELAVMGNLEFLESAMNLIHDHDQMEIDGHALRAQCDVYMNFVRQEMAGSQGAPAGEPKVHVPLVDPEYYALSFSVVEQADRLFFFWKYNVAIWPPERIELLAGLQEKVMQAFCQNSGITARLLLNNLKRYLVQP